jgi:hypothetical protein
MLAGLGLIITLEQTSLSQVARDNQGGLVLRMSAVSLR